VLGLVQRGVVRAVHAERAEHRREEDALHGLRVGQASILSIGAPPPSPPISTNDGFYLQSASGTPDVDPSSPVLTVLDRGEPIGSISLADLEQLEARTRLSFGIGPSWSGQVWRRRSPRWKLLRLIGGRGGSD